MKINQAIADADVIRPNFMDHEKKYKIIHELDCRVAEMMGKQLPEYKFPENVDLLMKDPFDNIYPRYLCALVDLYNNDVQTYANDMELFNTLMANAETWWIKHNRPQGGKGWVTI